MFGYRAYYESQPSASVDFLRVVQLQNDGLRTLIDKYVKKLKSAFMFVLLISEKLTTVFGDRC